MTLAYFLIVTEILLLISSMSFKNKFSLKDWIIFFHTKITFSIILTVWKLLSIIEEFKAIKMNWDKLERIGALKNDLH